jgi:hypothetical protein
VSPVIATWRGTRNIVCQDRATQQHRHSNQPDTTRLGQKDRWKQLATADDASLIRPTFYLTNKNFLVLFSKKNNLSFSYRP